METNVFVAGRTMKNPRDFRVKGEVLWLSLVN